MPNFVQRFRAFWGNSQSQDIAEYAVMLTVIIVLVIGTVKMLSRKRNSPSLSQTPAAAKGFTR